MNPEPNMIPNLSWDELFMKDVYAIAAKSKDPRTKIGAVILHWDAKDPISRGFNGLARKLNDAVPERWKKPLKHKWMSHAEHNSVCHCARTGRATEGTTMFTQGIPCEHCMDSIIQAGIARIVCHQQWIDAEIKLLGYEIWVEKNKISREKSFEAGIGIRWFSRFLGVDALMDGNLLKL